MQMPCMEHGGFAPSIIEGSSIDTLTVSALQGYQVAPGVVNILANTADIQTCT